MPFCAYCGTPVDQISYVPCPTCGRPRNGAPPMAVKSGTNAAVIIAIVLVGALLAVAFIGIVAAIAIPNLLTAMQRAKQKRTMADIRTISSAVQAYQSDNRTYPSDLTSLAPKYIKVVPVRDGWGNLIRYECWNAEGASGCDAYAVASAGKDGLFEHDDLKQYADGGATTNFNSDIVYSNGSFVQYPEGVQH